MLINIYVRVRGVLLWCLIRSNEGKDIEVKGVPLLQYRQVEVSMKKICTSAHPVSRSADKQ